MSHSIIPHCIVAAMDTREFFRELLRRKGLSTNSLAVALKESGKTASNIQPSLNRWLNDPARIPEVETMLPVADFFGVSLDAFYRPKAARQELARLNGLDHTVEVVTEVTQTPPAQSHDRFDALPEEQRSVLAEVTALLADAFLRSNRPPSSRKRGSWKLEQGAVMKQIPGKRRSSGTKKKGGGRSSG